MAGLPGAWIMDNGYGWILEEKAKSGGKKKRFQQAGREAVCDDERMAMGKRLTQSGMKFKFPMYQSGQDAIFMTACFYGFFISWVHHLKYMLKPILNSTVSLKKNNDWFLNQNRI